MMNLQLQDEYDLDVESEDTLWKVTNLDSAEWAASKATYHITKAQEISDWEKRQIDRIKRVARQNIEHHARKQEFFEYHLGLYLREQIEAGHPTKSLALPSGVVSLRKRQPIVDVGDNSAAVAWAQENQYKHMLRVKVDLDKTAFKKSVELADNHTVIDPSTGEVLPFARWEDQEDSLSFAPAVE